ncbi:MAG: MobF family relaxase [Candidatus Nanopelagicales bacterium]
MLSIGLVASAEAAATYFLGSAPGCQANYYLRPGGHSGRWIGGGAAALGLSGSLDVEGERAFRFLLDGCDPHGERLVEPVLRADPRSLLPASPLVKAVRSAAAALGVPVPFLLDDRRLVDRFAALARRPAGRRGIRVDHAVRMAEPTGRDLHSIYARPGSARSGLVERARRHLGKRVDTRRAGYDLTFSAPKSVSLLAAFGGRAVREAVVAAHAAAVADAVGWLERTTATAARGHHGDGRRADRVETSGFVAAAFEHGTSRAGDPQVHTHVVVANLLHGADGRWSAVDSRAVYRHGKTAGYLYQAALRAQLTERLGVEWEPTRKGSAEIVGVPRAVRRAFAKRSQQVRTALRAAGAAGPKAAQATCLDTRPDKEGVPAEELGRRWAAELRELGFAPRELVAACVDRAGVPPVPPDLVQRLMGADGLTRHATSFDLDDVLQAISSGLPSGADVATIDRLAADVTAHPEVVALRSPDDSSIWSPRWTTTELLLTEQRAIATADLLRTHREPASRPQAVDAATATRTLGPDQVEMVRVLTSGRGRMHVVVGPAGSGKTAALAAAYEVWSGEGRHVVGAALSAMAARQLRQGSGIPSGTVAQALNGIDRAFAVPGDLRLSRGSVLVIDEAGMVGTRDLDRLLAHVAEVGATVVLVGDPAQLPEIEAGGVFAELASRGAIELRTNRRQDAAWERAALAELRDGDPGRALDAYVAHGRVHIVADRDALHAQVVADYLEARRDGADVAILASTRAQVRALNDHAREELAAAGELAGPELVIAGEQGGVALRAGDRVIVTVNDYPRGLLNGTQATVTAVDVPLGVATVVAADGGVHSFGRDQLSDGWLDHAYALTCHKAQGQTLDRALVVGSAALGRETAYVALSRGREENRLYLAPEPSAESHGPEWLLDAVMATTDQHFRRSARHLLATRQVSEPEEPHSHLRVSTPEPDRGLVR